MTFRMAFLLTALSLELASTRVASASDDHLRVAQPVFEMASGAAVRQQPNVAWRQPSASASKTWRDFAAQNGQWRALWDRDTGIPLRILGAGIPAPGSTASAKVAEGFARGILTRYIELLAPGSRSEDFTLSGNHFDGSMRTVAMVQHSGGLRVLGGQISFRFKNDRLFVIASEALPHVSVAAVAMSPDTALAQRAAAEWIGADTESVESGAVDGPHILPVIRRGQVEYYTAMRVTVAGSRPDGRWHVYVDPSTGGAIAREQTMRDADGTVLYRVPERHPGSGRVTLPARDVVVIQGNGELVTNGDGELSWPGTGATQISTTVRGPYVRVESETGSSASASLRIEPGGSAVWDDSSEKLEAQLSAFVHGRIAKEYSRRFAPELEFLDEQLGITVNSDNTCNARSDGITLRFSVADDECQNTGRIADIVYHEFGHALHFNSFIRGAGRYEPAFSEGLSDYLAATITNDPAVGRGLRYTDDPLRHIDPPDREYRWPDDVERVHQTGLIFAGAMWDLRKALIDRYGQTEGVALADRLFYSAVLRASNIPATTIEVLAADDDNGDLSDGTPNECDIIHAFGNLHGLRDLAVDFEPIGALPPEQESYEIRFAISGLQPRCPGDSVAAATLYWGLRDDPSGELSNTIDMVGSGDGGELSFAAAIPQQESGSVVRYRVEVELTNGYIWRYPANDADPAYELYVGELIELYCTDFESDPFTEEEEWTRGPQFFPVNITEWQWGPPMAELAGGDPPAPFSGSSVIGSDLGDDIGDSEGRYRDRATTFARTPVIDVGNLSDVRLQYRRWLTVEDRLFDEAAILVIQEDGDRVLWRNLRTESGVVHHLDKEWVFHDVPLSRGIFDSEISVSFELSSDAGLEFGGWTIDDLCVVADPNSICGDGNLTGPEQCDLGDGNSDTEPDGCRKTCRTAYCGDGVLDSGEDCDYRDELTDGCTSECTFESSGCGCSVGEAQRFPGLPLGPLFFGMALLFWCRRRARG